MPTTFYIGSRSRFVNATAWVAIAMAVGFVASLGLQQAALAVMLEPPAPRPPLVEALLRGWPWTAAAVAGLSLMLVTVAIGLLQRLDWARRAFIALSLLAIVAHGPGLWLQHELVHAAVQRAVAQATLPADVAGVFGGLATAAQVMAGLIALAACALLAWVIRRLTSAPVRQEFS